MKKKKNMFPFLTSGAGAALVSALVVVVLLSMWLYSYFTQTEPETMLHLSFIGIMLVVVSSFVTLFVVFTKEKSFFTAVQELEDANERALLMLDTSPICTQIWSKDLKTIDCNEAGVRLYGFKDKAEYRERFIIECSPEYQPDGRRSDDKAVDLVCRTFEEGYSKFEWMHRMPSDGSLIPAEITLVRVEYKGDYVVLGYTHDLRKQEEMMQGINYRDNMLQTVNFVAINMLNTEEDLFSVVLNQSMNMIAEAVDVDCVYLWKNKVIDGELNCYQVFEWSENGTKYYDEMMCKYDDVVPGWQEVLSSGECINSLVCNMSPREQAHLMPTGIVSILVIPIFVKDEFWGFVGFDDCKKERIFTKEEEASLRSASLIIANSFIRNDMLQKMQNASMKLEHRGNILQAVNDASMLLLSTKEDENIQNSIMKSMELIGNALDVDRAHIWRNEIVDGKEEFLHIYEWLSEKIDHSLAFDGTEASTFSGMDEWRERFSRKEYVGGVPVSKMSSAEREYFGNYGVKSVILIPIFSDDKFWGLFTIDDCTNERVFSKDEVAILRSISLMMLSALNRHALVANRTRELAFQTTIFSTLFDSLPDIVFAKDLDMRYTHCNKAFLRCMGDMHSQDVVGKKDVDVWESPTIAQKLNDVDFRVMRENKTITSESTMEIKGVEFIFKTTKVPLVIDDKCIGLLGISYDITERRKNEHLANLRNQYVGKLNATLAEITKSPDVTAGVLHDAARFIAEKGCLALNASGIGIWIFSEEENALDNFAYYDNSTGTNIPQEKFNLSDKDKYSNLINTERLIVMNNLDECQTILVKEYDSLAGALDAPVRIDGKLAGVVCVEQKPVDEFEEGRAWTLDEQNFVSSLADLVSLAISGSERLNAREIAEDANKAKSEFLASMSHEIRTPMNAILGITEILVEEEALPRHIAEGLEKIYSSCNLLLSIIDDILDFSKIEAGKLDIEPVEYCVASLINDAIQMNMNRISEKPILFELLIGENIPVRLIGDDIRIKQVLNNLLSNAFKYTERGKVTLTVEFVRGRGNEDTQFVITVEDTGCGMSEEDAANLFVEYFRVTARKKTIQGTGLGLAITNRLVTLMNGDIKMRSELKKGTVFTVRIPQKIVDNRVLSDDVVEGLKRFRVNYITTKKRVQIVRELMPYGSVLVVDDMETNLYVAVGLMKLYRLQIDTANSGAEAIQKVKDGKVYDIIFMDHMMPVMDGIEATKQLRELGYKAPIVALTANAVLGRKDLFMSSGFDEFVAKPIDIRELNLILHKYVHEKKSRRAADMSSADEQQLATAPFLDSIDEEFDSDIDENFNVKIEGLDVEKGIERYGGDKKTYITLLRSYASSVSNILRTIEAGASKDNISIYETSVHGIKGASWDIFADEVGTAAKELEFAAKADDLGFIEKNHAPFVELANKLISEIQLTLEILDTENPKQKKIKPEEEILEKLLTACKTYNMDDVDAAIDEIEEYEYTDDDGLAQWLREKIDRSDFRQIVERLSQNT